MRFDTGGALHLHFVANFTGKGCPLVTLDVDLDNKRSKGSCKYWKSIGTARVASCTRNTLRVTFIITRRYDEKVVRLSGSATITSDGEMEPATTNTVGKTVNVSIYCDTFALSGGTLNKSISWSGKARATWVRHPLNADSQLARIIPEYKQALSAYLRRWQQPLARLCHNNGTLANLESGFAFLFSAVAHGSVTDPKVMAKLRTGCQQTRDETDRVLAKAMAKFKSCHWTRSKLIIGSKWQHVAMGVHKKGTSFKQGFVFDPWMHQRPEVFPYAQWSSRFWHYRLIKGGRVGTK